jgi:phosphoglycerol transferase
MSRPASAAAATLFALAPYHFFRMQHTFLAFYIMLPPALAIAIRIADGEEFPFTNPDTRRKSLFVLLILLATVSTGIYYSFFVAVFIAVAGALAAVRFRNWRRLIAPALFLCVILIGFVINTAPNLYQLATAPPNPDAVKRYSGESEVYALRLTNLLLPVLDDRIPALAAMTRRYEATVPYSESSTAGVGLLTDVGILILLAVALAACAGIPAPRPLGALAALMLAGILLGTFGGFGPLFAFLVSPLLRSWGRISICLAFFSLCALAMLADRFVFLQPARAKNKALLAALLILFSVGVWEQIPWIDINEQDIAKHWRWDDNFVRLIEARVGHDATIFQLPYVPFPEGPLVGHMADYDLFRGYFHSDTLAWSYGSMRGRDGDKWQEAVASLPVPQMLSKLRDAKFDGIYFDRFGDLPNTADLLNQLQSTCGPPVVSEDPDHRLLFFSLKPLQP